MEEQQITNWTPEIMKIIEEQHVEIIDHLKKRWGEEFASMISLDCQFKQGYTIEFTCKIGEKQIEDIAEMQRSIITEWFGDMAREPERYKEEFRRMYGSSTMLVIERAVGQLFNKSIPILLKASTESVQDNEGLLAKGKTIIPFPSVPENVILIHPETFEGIKKEKR